MLNRRVVVTSMMSRPLVRSYTIIPSMPAVPASGTTTQVVKTDDYNSVHALYNNENQSVHESHLNTAGQTYRSLSSDDHHSTFGPTFNSVFDE